MILQVNRLSKKYDTRPVVNAVSLTVSPGQIIGLIGPNGAGKTTTFHMIAGLTAPDKGKIQLGDHDITSFPIYKRAQQGIAYLPQKASIFRDLTVADNIMAVLELKDMANVQRKQILTQLLDQFQLTPLRHHKGHTLSGGERRRTEIARALATQPKYLLLDEPFAGIDPIAIYQIHQIIQELKKQGIGILITDHNAEATLAITDYTYLLIDGKIFKEGTPQVLANDSATRAQYLGPHFKLTTHTSST